MQAFEIRYHPHVHTRFSDGHGTYWDVLRAAARAGLHAVQITDHNLLVTEVEGYYSVEGRRILLLVGQEIHDPTLIPGKNHLLAFRVSQDFSPYALGHPQKLIDAVLRDGGLTFIAHPIDGAVPFVEEGDFSWRDWDIQGFHGIELWNAMSEFKRRIPTRAHAVYYAYRFHRVARGPFPETLRLWDRLIREQDRPIVAIGGSDAHALPARLGPLRRTLFPYEWHFRAVNTHLLLPRPLKGDIDQDRELIYQALRKGHAFVAYDLPAPTDGFRFWATGKEGIAWMGDRLPIRGPVTLHLRTPQKATLLRLLRDGVVVQSWQHTSSAQWVTHQPGAYRVEAYLHVWGRLRGWIFSNPIYLESI